MDIQRAIILDEAAERGEQRPGAGVIDADFHVEEPDEPEQPMTDEEKAELGKKIEEARAK